MNSRSLFSAILSVLLLILAAGPGLARGPQPTGPPDTVGTMIGMTWATLALNVEAKHFAISPHALR